MRPVVAALVLAPVALACASRTAAVHPAAPMPDQPTVVVEPAPMPVEPEVPADPVDPVVVVEPAPQPPAVRTPIAWDTRDPELGGADRVRGDEAPGLVAFTFDDGPSEETTPQVLDALDAYDIPATFFVTTRRVTGRHGVARIALLERVAAGHVIGSHTQRHPDLRTLDAAGQLREIDGSIKTLTRLLQRPIGLFRPPFGAMPGPAASHLRKLGVTDVRWDPDSLDFRTPSPTKLRANVMAKLLAHDGGVVLMHDTKQATAHAIAGILDDLEAENCRRLAAGQPPIVPVSIHYFLRDNGAPRSVPAAAQARTDAYRAALPERCSKRQ